MAQVAVNADEYAAPRQNWFFPGVVPSLDGQCVSLVKWFMQEMSEVPNPQAARGDARYVGKTLVAQGHAVEVPYADRKRGDIICYEFGVYGHIAVQLSGGRVFEQNVNLGGVSSKIVDGERVYASRIGSETEAWRKNVHVYRLKTYSEGGNGMDTNLDQARAMTFAFEGNDGFYGPNALTGACDDGLNKYVVGKKKLDVALGDFYMSPTALDFRGRYMPDLVARANNAAVYQRQAQELLVQNVELQKKLAAYENGDTIVITRKGWNGLFDVLQQWFSKKNV